MRTIVRMLAPLGLALCLGAPAVAQEPAPKAETKAVEVGTFAQQEARKFSDKEGLPSTDVLSLTVLDSGEVAAGTKSGLARFANDRWSVVSESEGMAIPVVASHGNTILAVADGTLYSLEGGDISEIASIPSGVGAVTAIASDGTHIAIGTDKGAYHLDGSAFVPVAELGEVAIRAIALGPEGHMAVAAQSGLFERVAEGAIAPLTARDEAQSWAPYDVRGVAYDAKGRLWFASPQGVGVRDGDGWKLYTEHDGIPYKDFTSVAAAPDGSVWFGTKIGAVRFDGQNWEYREGKRWLPGNEVRDVAVGPQGAWFATDAGVGLIKDTPMTFAQKARFYEDNIDKYHRRTPYGFVLEVALPAPGDLSSWEQHDSDNDGLWTSMYGAGECYAYGATKDPYFKERSRKAFEALRFLMDVTQGGTPPSQPGFVARTVLPTSGPNPNETHYTVENDREKQQNEDKRWKIMSPRWGTSADGQWYWKADTSSDELDGHYFFHALYYDLVAETEQEKDEVRKVVVALTDHLLRNNYQLVDHDGQPTRWAVYNPEQFNDVPDWFMERGLNSLSILSHLATAHHMTGDAKYKDAMDELVNKHGYHMNLMFPKWQNGPGSGNHSDDEMAFMCYYNLLKYIPKDSKLWQPAAFSFWSYWKLEMPELNPLFNFMYPGIVQDGVFNTSFSDIQLAPQGPWLEESIDTLKRFPLDRIDWRQTNSHRTDIERLPNYLRQPEEFDDPKPSRTGRRMNGKVIPVDERYFNHWNHDPYSLNEGGNGQELGTGTVYLLPYYMGLYHGFIAE